MTELTLNSGCVQARENGAVLHLTLDRAEKLNAMTTDMYQDLTRGVEHLAERDDLRVLLLTGNGRSWCAGNDIGDFLNADPASRDNGKLSPAMLLVHALMALDKPVVMGVQGNATGIGTTLLLHADLVVAADDARFQTAFINLGLVPEAGSSLQLPALIGRQNANRLMMNSPWRPSSCKRCIGVSDRLVGMSVCVSESEWIPPARGPPPAAPPPAARMGNSPSS